RRCARRAARPALARAGNHRAGRGRSAVTRSRGRPHKRRRSHLELAESRALAPRVHRRRWTAGAAGATADARRGRLGPRRHDLAARGRLMRILWLKSDLLLPLDKGGKLRTWHLLRHLARRHEVTYLAFADPATPKADLDGMKQVAAHVHTVPWSDAPKRSWRFHADAAAHLVDPLPYAVA